ncbi:MAG: PAS domain S-box protein, partial [bacterium]|nr:PAS domain S-box protein [bacterium]
FIGLMTTDGTLIEANRTALNFAGIEAEDVLGKPFWETPWWNHSAELQKRLREAVSKSADGHLECFEAAHPATDGTMHIIDFSLKPVKDEAGNVIFLLPEGNNITERKQAEEEMQRLRSLLQNIVDSMPSILVGVNSGGKVTQWNTKAEKETGVKAEEAQGNALVDVFPALAGEMEKVRKTMKNRTLQKNTRIVSEKNGETRFSDITVYPLVANRIEGAVIRVDDVTERV